jgi:hypothetical protein
LKLRNLPDQKSALSTLPGREMRSRRLAMRRLSVGLLRWSIRPGQELIDHARTLLLLYPSLLRSLLLGPEFVIYFPAH